MAREGPNVSSRRLPAKLPPGALPALAIQLGWLTICGQMTGYGRGRAERPASLLCSYSSDMWSIVPTVSLLAVSANGHRGRENGVHWSSRILYSLRYQGTVTVVMR